MSAAPAPGVAAPQSTVTVEHITAGRRIPTSKGGSFAAVEGTRIVMDADGRKYLSVPMLDQNARAAGKKVKLQAPTGIAAIDAASTQFETLFSSAMMQAPATTVSDQIAWRVPMTGKTLGIPVPLARPLPRAWNGSAKQFKNGRTAYYSGDLQTYEVSTAINRIDLNYDPSGVVNAWVDGFRRIIEYADDYLLLTLFNANAALGLDGVALGSASHVYATNTNNLSTSAFSRSVFKSARASLYAFADEYGTPFNLGTWGMKVVAGTTIEMTVREVLLSELRAQAVDSSGAFDTTSSVVGAAAVPNQYQRLGVTPIFTQWLNSGLIGSGNQWMIIADLPGDARPFVIGEGRQWEPQMQIDMGSEARFMLDEFRFSGEADKVYLPGFWPSIVLSVT